MRIFWLKIFSLALAVIVSMLMLILFVPGGKSGTYFASSIDKHRRLSSYRKSSKVIVVGGSGAALGIDSALISESLRMPVVNMGIHAGLGLQFMLDEVLPDVRAGDIVLIIPEYDYFFELPAGSEEGRSIIGLLLEYPNAIRYLHSPKQYFAVLDDIPSFVRIKEGNLESWFNSRLKLKRVAPSVKANPSDIYVRSSFNENGDFIAHLDLPSPGFSKGYGALPENLNKRTIQSINSFLAKVNKRRATAVMAYPAFASHDYKLNQSKIIELDSVLRRELKAEILGTPELFAMDDKYFYDSVYHLNGAGRKFRTQMLTRLLNSHGK